MRIQDLFAGIGQIGSSAIKATTAGQRIQQHNLRTKQDEREQERLKLAKNADRRDDKQLKLAKHQDKRAENTDARAAMREGMELFQAARAAATEHGGLHTPEGHAAGVATLRATGRNDLADALAQMKARPQTPVGVTPEQLGSHNQAMMKGKEDYEGARAEYYKSGGRSGKSPELERLEQAKALQSLMQNNVDPNSKKVLDPALNQKLQQELYSIFAEPEDQSQPPDPTGGAGSIGVGIGFQGGGLDLSPAMGQAAPPRRPVQDNAQYFAPEQPVAPNAPRTMSNAGIETNQAQRALSDLQAQMPDIDLVEEYESDPDTYKALFEALESKRLSAKEVIELIKASKQ